jgi:hypothetical protein
MRPAMEGVRQSLSRSEKPGLLKGSGRQSLHVDGVGAYDSATYLDKRHQMSGSHSNHRSTFHDYACPNCVCVCVREREREAE